MRAEPRFLRSPIFRQAMRLWCACSLSLGARTVAAQNFQLSNADVADSTALTQSMPRLAAEVLATYRDTARARFLDNLFRLQILTARYSEASASLTEGRALRTSRQDATPQARALHVQYQIFVTAKNLAESSGRPFPEIFAESFRETFARLDDRTAVLAARAILVSARTVADDLRWATPNQTGKTTVALEDALTLLHVYQAVESYRASPVSPRLWSRRTMRAATPSR